MASTADRQAQGNGAKRKNSEREKNEPPPAWAELKTKAGKAFLAEVNARFSDLAFSLSQFDDELKARAGLSECAKTSHLQPYPVLLERSKAPVAHAPCSASAAACSAPAGASS